MNFKFILPFIMVLAVFSCKPKQQTTSDSAIDVNLLVQTVDQRVDQEVIIQGLVNHVCTHSGQRCFIIDSTGDFSIRVEAAGDLEGFSQEIMGTTIKVKGIVKEERLSADEIAQMEAAVLEEHPEDAESNGENCSAEMANILEMRNWMKEHDKNYFATYYVDGLSYEMVQ